MKTETQILEIRKQLQKELSEVDKDNIFAKGFIQGQIDFTFVVLEDNND